MKQLACIFAILLASGLLQNPVLADLPEPRS